MVKQITNNGNTKMRKHFTLIELLVDYFYSI